MLGVTKERDHITSIQELSRLPQGLWQNTKSRELPEINTTTGQIHISFVGGFGLAGTGKI